MDRIQEILTSFPKQLSWQPEVVNSDALVTASSYVIGGMGGSGLAARLLEVPHIQDYLPPDPIDASGKTLYIASSFSGTTEETVSFAEAVIATGAPLACIASGGTLITIAQSENLPHIILPTDGWQPRYSLGFSLRALAELTNTFGQEDFDTASSDLAKSYEALNVRAQALAEGLSGTIPLIYSWRTDGLAYTWKIAMNENAHTPAFCNAWPELNHNEIVGFDVTTESAPLRDAITIIALRGTEPEFEQGIKRIDATLETLRDHSVRVEEVDITGPSPLHEIATSSLLAYLTSYHLAKSYDADPSDITIVENFKKKIT